MLTGAASLHCIPQVPDGVVPNQHGTFLYGRCAWGIGLLQAGQPSPLWDPHAAAGALGAGLPPAPLRLPCPCTAFSPPAKLPSCPKSIHPTPACRNGWCPGQDVAPWLADVTSALRPAGQPNRITYRGTLLNGSEPGQPAGVLLMQSNLVFFLGC